MPGIMSNEEAMRQAQQEGATLMQTLDRESTKMEQATPEKLVEYVKYCEKRIGSDPRIKTYPGLDESVRKAERKALALLEDQGLEMVSKKIMAAKKLTPAEKANITETVIDDLDQMITYWQKKSEGKIDLASSEKLKRLMFDAKTLKDSQFNA